MSRRLIEKAEYLLSQEQGTVFKDPGGRISIALVYPNTYSVGMSSLGFQGIYGLLNNMQDVVCERVFLPDAEDYDEFIRTRTEPFSLESRRRLSQFDIIAFSVSFENDFPNILKLLFMAKIPLRSSGRNSSHPLIIMGGVCAFSNPEPLADFMDICFVGEAEEMIQEFLQVCRITSTRAEIFEQSMKIEGLYVPKYYSVNYYNSGAIQGRRSSGSAPAKIRKRTVSNISKSFLKSAIITREMEFSGMHLIEAMRGCPWSCRFCLAGHIYNPARKKDFASISAEIEDVKKNNCRIGLIGPSLTDLPHAEQILSIEGVDFSITSLRASVRSAGLVNLMKGHKRVSIAPEAGTQRLRNVINKQITEKDILDTSKLILESGIETLRLYFMIGLPTESLEDVEGIVELVKLIRKHTKKGSIRMSVSTFIPKPFTPFQWHPMITLKDAKEKISIIKKGLGKAGGISVHHDMLKSAHLQGLFALGDRRVGDIVEEMAIDEKAATKYKATDIINSFYIFRKKDISENLPWDFIDAGISKEHLWKEYQKALKI